MSKRKIINISLLFQLLVLLVFVTFTISCETQSVMRSIDNQSDHSPEVAISEEAEIILDDSSMIPREEDVLLTESATSSNPENYAAITFSTTVPVAETSLPTEEKNFQNNTTNDISHQQISQSETSDIKTSRSYTTVIMFFAVFAIILSFLLFAKKKKAKLSKKHSDNQHSVIYSEENETKNDNNTAENSLIVTNSNNEIEIAESEKTEEINTDFSNDNRNYEEQPKPCIIEDSIQKECTNDCPIGENGSEKQSVVESHSAEYIPIPGFTPVQGNFFSNYVCVIFIDDGRYFIDYHFNNNPKPYGPGRLFSHSSIQGVNYKDGKYIKGGKDRLSIVAIYEVETEKDAKDLFGIALEAYKSRFSELVIYNKGNSRKTNNKAKKLEHKITTLLVTDYFRRNLVFNSFDSFQEEYGKQITNWDSPFYIKTKNNGRLNKDQLNCIIKATTYIGFENSIYITVTVRFSDLKDDSQLSICSSTGKVSFLSNFSSENEFVFSLKSSIEHSDNNEPIKDKVDSLINILSGEDVHAICDNKTFPIDTHSINNVLLLLKSTSFIIYSRNEKFEQDRLRWFEDNCTIPMEYYKTLNAKNIKCEKLNYEEPSIIIGASGNRYQTSLSNCSCSEFQTRDFEKLLFRPCKHMVYLAKEMGVADLLVNPEPDSYTSDPVVEKILKSRDTDFKTNKPTILTGLTHPKLEFWTDIPICISGIVIEKPFLYTIGESELQNEISKSTIHCSFEDNPYLPYYRRFYSEETLHVNKELLTSYLDSDCSVVHALVLPNDGLLEIPEEEPTVDLIERVKSRDDAAGLCFFSKKAAGCFIKWLSAYYPEFQSIRYYSTEHTKGIWVRAFKERKDLLEIIHYFGEYLISEESYSDADDSYNIDYMRWFLALLLIYTQSGNELNEDEKHFVSVVIKKVLTEKRSYIYKSGWRWDPVATLYECGCKECIPDWLIMKQYIASKDLRKSYEDVLQRYLTKYNFSSRIVFSKRKKAVDYLYVRLSDMEDEIPYFVSWKLNDTNEIDLIIDNINDYQSQVMLPEFFKDYPEKEEWFRLPKEIRKLYQCPLSNEDLATLISQPNSIRDALCLFGFVDSNKTVPRNRETLIKNVNYIYECIGYTTNIIVGASLDSHFYVQPL